MSQAGRGRKKFWTGGFGVNGSFIKFDYDGGHERSLGKTPDMIPKLIHFIWVGDESKRPDNCIRTWVDHHPGWEFRIWGNAELADNAWINRHHIAAMHQRELNGVADLMRWEILYAHGGLVLDADSICLRPLDDSLLDCDAFACWESEIARPGLIAAGYFGCAQGNELVLGIIADIAAETSVVHEQAWRTVGPLRLTESYRKYQYFPLRIYPSHYFIPRHYSGLTYDGPGPIYADQLWGSTRSAYDQLYRLDVTSASTGRGQSASPSPVPAPVAAVSPLEKAHAPYFVQRVAVDSGLIGLSRLDVFSRFCAGKRVLHIGCADWPITDPARSLHLALEPYCAVLDGFDIHEEALGQLAPYTTGALYSRFEDLTDAYDMVLVPEVLEHVPDAATFIRSLESLDAAHFLVSVPDAFQCRNRHFDYLKDSQVFVEVVHPDHNAWYTPYTFSNAIRKYSGLRIEKMWFFNNISILALLAKPETLPASQNDGADIMEMAG